MVDKIQIGITRLSKGMIQLLNAYRPYGRMLMHLDRVIDPELACPLGPVMAGVTSRTLYWNPVMAAEVPMPQVRAVLLHEAFHLVLQHLGRVKKRDPLAWNYVSDKKCNQYVKEIEDSRVGLDVTGLLMPDHDELELTTEQLYKRLPPQNVTVKYLGPDSPVCGEGTKVDANNPPTDVQRQIWENRVRDLLSKEAGKLPAGLRRELEEFLNPEVPWQQILREYADESARGMTDFTWRKFNAMWRIYGIYYPGLKGERVNVYFAADTSGSMGPGELKKVFTEAKEVLDLYGDVYFMACDAALHQAQRVDDIDALVKLADGGGGTDFRPVFEHVNKKFYTEEIPPVLVFATDGYGAFPDYIPPYPVIWLMIHTDVDPKFGRIIHIKR